MIRLHQYILPITLIVISCIFGAFLPHELVYDDILLVGQNSTLQQDFSVLDIFSAHLWEGTPQTDDTQGSYYRPLMVLSLVFDAHVLGESYALHHLHSLFWHLLCCGLFWFWAGPFVHTARAKVFALWCFAIHPVQLEIVLFLAARNDAMACAGILSMLLALRHERFILAAASLLCALLSKESALLLPAVWVVIWIWKKRSIPTKASASIGCALILYGSLRIWADIPWPPSTNASLSQLAMGILVYCDHLFFPDMLVPATHVLWPSTKEIFGGSIGLFAMFVLFRYAKKDRTWCFSLIGAGLLPAFAAIAQTGLAADRYLYISMLGFSILVANGIARYVQKWSTPIFLFFVCGLVIQSIRILPHWQSNLELFRKGAHVHDSPYQAGALAKALEEEGLFEEAAFWYEKAVQPPLPYQHSCFNITWIHLLRGDMDQLIRAGESAISAGCAPSEELLAPLALAYTTKGRWTEAQKIVDRSTRDPRNILKLTHLCLLVHHRDSSVLSMPEIIQSREDIERVIGESDPDAILWLKAQELTP